jgi:hypothetical protein
MGQYEKAMENYLKAQARDIKQKMPCILFLKLAILDVLHM